MWRPAMRALLLLLPLVVAGGPHDSRYVEDAIDAATSAIQSHYGSDAWFPVVATLCTGNASVSAIKRCPASCTAIRRKRSCPPGRASAKMWPPMPCQLAASTLKAIKPPRTNTTIQADDKPIAGPKAPRPVIPATTKPARKVLVEP